MPLIIIACEDSLKFEEPQPSGKSNLTQIPRKLKGIYLSNTDSTFLTINEEQVIERMDIVTRTIIDSLDFDIDSTKIKELTPDSTQIVDGKYNLSFKFLSGDSVIVYYAYRDTLFKISDDHILRRFKGHYFLNYKRAENNWTVRRLTLAKDELSFSKVRLSGDMEELKKLTEIEEIKSDSGKVVGYKLNPSRKELKHIMKHSFSETKTYRRTE